MDIKLTCGMLKGEVKVPSSKSAAHRAVIAAAIAKGKSRITNVTMCDDIIATLNAVSALGGKVAQDAEGITITGIAAPAPSAVIDCCESGSTLRFMIPIAAAYGTNTRFIGKGRLPQRPIDDIIDALTPAGISFARTDKDYLPLDVIGKLENKEIYIAGNVSSQYLTGLLFARSIAGGKILLTTNLESSGYVDMTCQMIEKFGGKVEIENNRYSLSGTLCPTDIYVEGDWSAAAFFFEAAALGGSVSLIGLDPQSAQADKACLDIFGKMGVGIRYIDGVYHLSPAEQLTATDMDASQCPDLVPAVAVAMAFAKGTSTIYNAGRLRIKESDRLEAVANGLKALGIETKLENDKITIFGGKGHGGTVDSVNDHRIAMAFACAASAVEGDIIIKGAHTVSKSYPDFFKVFNLLGGKSDVIDNR